MIDIGKLLLTVAVRFEAFYKTWFKDDESFDPAWMDLSRWKETRNNAKIL